MAEATSTEMTPVSSQAANLLPGMSSLAPLKQVGMLVAIAASIALGVFIALWSKEPPMRPLSNLPAEMSMDVINYLEQQDIQYRIDASGKVLVPQGRYKRIQIELGSQGIQIEDTSEDPYLNKDSGFGVSQRMEQARLLRNKELQITSTLNSFNGVKSAKVHLAIPKESSFIKNRKEPSASVLLNLYSRSGLSPEQVDAMVDLVSGSIPNLDRNKVSIADQYGRLYHSGTMDSSSRETSKEMSIIRERQMEIKSRIEEILNPIVGLGKYTVQVNVDMDFTQKEQTLQTFNPDLPAVRSERTIEDSRTQGQASGIPGALSNQPPGASTIPTNTNNQGANPAQQLPANTRLEAERNYDLDTTISHIKPQVGTTERISVSVGLDYITDPANADLEVARPLPQMERISRLIQAAIGYSPQRGDLVSVESFPFVDEERLPTPAAPPFYEQELFQTLLKPGIGLILGLFVIFGLLRPLFRRLSSVPAGGRSFDEEESDELDLSGLDGASGGLADDNVILSGNDSLELPPPTVGEVKKLEQAKGVVSNNPTLVAQLVKSWIEDNG